MAHAHIYRCERKLTSTLKGYDSLQSWKSFETREETNLYMKNNFSYSEIKMNEISFQTESEN